MTPLDWLAIVGCIVQPLAFGVVVGILFLIVTVLVAAVFDKEWLVGD